MAYDTMHIIAAMQQESIRLIRLHRCLSQVTQILLEAAFFRPSSLAPILHLDWLGSGCELLAASNSLACQEVYIAAETGVWVQRVTVGHCKSCNQKTPLAVNDRERLAPSTAANRIIL